MKTEFKVISTLCLLLLGLEVGSRLMETRLSKDVLHLRTLPQQAAAIRSAPKGTVRVLLLGNSLARCGIDVPRLREGLKQSLQRDVLVSVMHPDGSKVEEWAYGYWRYFRDTQSQPDAVLIITGRGHLTDKIRSLEDLGAFYVGSEDVRDFARHHLKSLDDGAAFFGPRYSALMAHRERVEPLVFYKWVPGYEQTVQELNRATNAPVLAAEAGCELFTRLAKGLKTSGVGLVVASAPLPEAFSLPANVKAAAEAAGAVVHEAGAHLKLAAERFPDHYHLDAEGAVMFTNDVLPLLISNLNK